MHPQRLKPDNFTPATRTPWGGRKILTRYKAALGLDVQHAVVGESWEVSVEPSFPSSTLQGTALSELIASDPVGWLGGAVAEAYGGASPLLVKLLDTADNLSVQVHPAPDDPALAPDESGKPESWIVLDAEPGAGIYLGFRDGVSAQQVRRCLETRGPLDELMNFVPAVPGDAFVIRAGTVHAIGAGVTMIEPQHVTPGRRGLTYRFWDWNRLYDEQGRLDMVGGKPRQLHVKRSLEVTAWDSPGGEAFVQSCRANGELLQSGSLEQWLVLRTPYFEAERWQGTGALEASTGDAMTALTCVAGEATVETPLGSVSLETGVSAVIPAAAASMSVTAKGAQIFVSRSCA